MVAKKYPLVEIESQKEIKEKLTHYTNELKIIKEQKNILSEKNNEIANKKLIEINNEEKSISNHLDLYKNKIHTDIVYEKTINEKSKQVKLTIEEEQEIASKEEYKVFVAKIIEAEKRENSIENEKEKIEILQDNLKLIIAEEVLLNKEKPEKSLLIAELEKTIIKRNKEIERLKTIQGELDKMISPDNKKRLELENLAFRRIEPLEKIITNESVSTIEQKQIIENGLSFNIEAKSTYSKSNPIPINVAPPSGLIYRVQIGAFRRPIPQDLYKEFTPVSGDKLSNGLTVYMAGYFNSQQKAKASQKEIRSLGYSDAFIVAYCNGKRMSFWKARQLEEKGECLPIGNSEFIAEIVKNSNNIAENSNTTNKNSIKENNNSVNNNENVESNNISAEIVNNKESININNAVKKDLIKNQKEISGLYYSVQIGVYNRAVKLDRFPSISEIMNIKLKNAQYHTPSCIFSSSCTEYHEVLEVLLYLQVELLYISVLNTR